MFVFPSDPQIGDQIPGPDGTVYTWNGVRWSGQSGAGIPEEWVGGGASVTVDTVAPGEPDDGDLWFNSIDRKTYIFYSDNWTPVLPPTISLLEPSSPRQGMLWFDPDDMQLYVWTGSTWVVAVNPPFPDVNLLFPRTEAEVVQGRISDLEERMGVISGHPALPGQIGEVVSQITTGTIAANTHTSITYITVPAGCWLVYGTMDMRPTAGVTQMQTYISAPLSVEGQAVDRAIISLSVTNVNIAQLVAPIRIIDTDDDRRLDLCGYCVGTGGPVSRAAIYAYRIR